MAAEVMGIFESADMAQAALSRLRDLRIPLISYRITPATRRSPHGDGGTGMGGFFAVEAFTTLAPSSGMGVTNSAFAPAGFMAPAVFFDDGDDRPSDTVSQEVELRLVVEDGAAGRVKSALISNHGRKVDVH